MLVTGAKRPDNIDNLLVKMALKGLSGGAINGMSIHQAKLAQRKFSEKMYMKNMKAQIGDYYKSKQ